MRVSPIMRRGTARYWHWCPACEREHPLPDSWNFNGDVSKPTFSPSFKQNFFYLFGDQTRRPNGDERTCHYIITDGKIQFCPDSWHNRSDIVAMPLLPDPVADFGCETQD